MKNFVMETNLQGDPALFMIGEEHLGHTIDDLIGLLPETGVIRIVPERLWLESHDLEG
ncbi:MAG: hypothetical protein HQL75_00875 [Magnetococcales bacterium]|nr:hypothetical protein [Magnetococcales bacterium]